MADAMRVMNGQFEPELDWFDVCKIVEIIETDLSKRSSIARSGWATKADLKRLKASANNPALSGDLARHARMSGDTPGPERKMTLAEANALVTRVVVAWVESRPDFATG